MFFGLFLKMICLLLYLMFNLIILGVLYIILFNLFLLFFNLEMISIIYLYVFCFNRLLSFLSICRFLFVIFLVVDRIKIMVWKFGDV